VLVKWHTLHSPCCEGNFFFLDIIIFVAESAWLEIIKTDVFQKHLIMHIKINNTPYCFKNILAQRLILLQTSLSVMQSIRCLQYAAQINYSTNTKVEATTIITNINNNETTNTHSIQNEAISYLLIILDAWLIALVTASCTVTEKPLLASHDRTAVSLNCMHSHKSYHETKSNSSHVFEWHLPQGFQFQIKCIYRLSIYRRGQQMMQPSSGRVT